jgi:hypothetical protein
MTKRRGRGIRKTRVIQNALARLGMQAKPKQVVAALADFGIDVSAGLIRQVKVEMVKEATKVERLRVKVPRAGRAKVRRPPKVLPGRGHRP